MKHQLCRCCGGCCEAQMEARAGTRETLFRLCIGCAKDKWCSMAQVPHDADPFAVVPQITGRTPCVQCCAVGRQRNNHYGVSSLYPLSCGS